MKPSPRYSGCCEVEETTEISANVPADEYAALVTDRAVLEAAKRYIKHVSFVDRGVLMAILGMEPEEPANADV